MANVAGALDQYYLSLIRDVRAQAYGIDPKFGKNVDTLITGWAGFGAIDPPIDANAVAVSSGVQATLNRLVSGFEAAAKAANLSLERYFDAMTNVRTMQAAAAAGVPVDVYRQTSAVTNTMSSIFANPGAPQTNILGVPLWVILGGVGLLLVMRR